MLSHKLFFLILSWSVTTFCKAQDCESLRVDLGKGTLNGVSPTASPEEVKKQLPCFTGETAEGESYNYGGGVFYLDHDFYFYTHQDYLEIRDEFTGTLSQPVMGATRKRLLALLGKHDATQKDDAGRTCLLYATTYGTLRLTLDHTTQTVVEVGIHAVKPAEVKLKD